MAIHRSDLSAASKYTCRLCRLEFLPIVKTIRDYDRGKARADLKAGVNVALLAFPQSMAYAVIAGLPIFYGLFTEIFAGIFGPLFSGSRFIIAGATNATAVLFFGTMLALGISQNEVMSVIPLLLVMVSLFIMIGAALGAANLLQFVSRSVITGYITAASLFIIVNQSSKVFGVHVEVERGFTLFGLAWKTLLAIPHSHLPTLLLSAVTAICYVVLEKKLPKLPNVALILVLMSVLGELLNRAIAAFEPLAQFGPIARLDGISPGALVLHLPHFSLAGVNMLLQPALVIAFLCTLEAVSVGKSVAAKAGQKLDVGRELFGIGTANMASALWGGMPVSGSPVRSQLNWTSGASTPLANIYSSFMVLAALFLIGPMTRFIPTGALGTLIVFIGFSLINTRVIRVVMKSTRGDALTFFVTFVSALIVRLDLAIILGTVTSIAMFLKKAAVPQLVEYGANEEGVLAPLDKPDIQPAGVQTIAVMHVEGDLFFGAAELFRDQMRRICEDKGLKIIILKLRNAHHLDATSILALEELIRYMRENDRTLLVSEAREETLKIFERSGLAEVVGKENIFPDDLRNSTLPTARALKRARELLHTRDAHISIVLGVQKRMDKPEEK
ncbi:MAG: SulP family inorganic anion transporter [Opitutales bacterium]|nr:SulP family inorganic anion transporter [Opitutales bacterium]